LLGQEHFTANPIAEYDELRDPDKAAEAIEDVVRGEGVAKGRPYLFLGEGAEAAVRGKCSKVLKVPDEWVVLRNTATEATVAKFSKDSERLNITIIRYL
jgi:hypothetical protein